MDRSKVLAALSALSHEHRLELVRLLMPQGETGLAAGEIGQRLGLGASRLSFHLAALEQAGLIRSRRASRNVFYTIDLGGIGGTIAYLLNECCMDHPEVMACCRKVHLPQAMDQFSLSSEP
jgi:ArsR family transcriptional regulator, arsenate/arsenite/antimonite-responsive transcriptional repressor